MSLFLSTGHQQLVYLYGPLSLEWHAVSETVQHIDRATILNRNKEYKSRV